MTWKRDWYRSDFISKHYWDLSSLSIHSLSSMSPICRNRRVSCKYYMFAIDPSRLFLVCMCSSLWLYTWASCADLNLSQSFSPDASTGSLNYNKIKYGPWEWTLRFLYPATLQLPSKNSVLWTIAFKTSWFRWPFRKFAQTHMSACCHSWIHFHWLVMQCCIISDASGSGNVYQRRGGELHQWIAVSKPTDLSIWLLLEERQRQQHRVCVSKSRKHAAVI